MALTERENEKHRENARRYVAEQEQKQKELRDKMARDHQEVRDRQIEGIHRRLQDGR